MNRSLVFVWTTIALASIVIQVPVFAQHSDHEEYEQYDNDNEYSSAQGELKISYKVITPAQQGHLSVCIVDEGFEFCKEYNNTSDRVVIGDMTTGVYHIAEGDNFEVCAELYPNGNSQHFKECVPMKNHENDHPEYAEITLTKTVCT